MPADIRLYRNCHLAAQIGAVRPPFIAFDATDNPCPEWREWQSLFRIHAEGRHRGPDYCGLFSSRFEAKSNLTGEDVLAHIAAHPGRDVYLFNWCPQARYTCLLYTSPSPRDS